jgi:hypothetical protein
MEEEFKEDVRVLLIEMELKWRRTGDHAYLDQLKGCKKIFNLYKRYYL